MGSISASGIGFAVLTAAWAISAAAQTSSPRAAELRVELEKLRNDKGTIHACLTQDRGHFPDCKGDSRAIRLSVSARDAGELRFRDLPGGTYALSIIHDENANGKLDTFAGIPREGFGFSGNPPIRFGPPKFEEADFTVTAGRNVQPVRLRYLL